MQTKNTTIIYFGYEYNPKVYIEDKKQSIANPLKRIALENIPNTGKTRKKNTHLKKRKKRK